MAEEATKNGETAAADKAQEPTLDEAKNEVPSKDDAAKASAEEEKVTEQTAQGFLPRLKRQLTQSGNREKPSKVVKEDKKVADDNKAAQMGRRTTIKVHLLKAVKTSKPSTPDSSKEQGKGEAKNGEGKASETQQQSEADAAAKEGKEAVAESAPKDSAEPQQQKSFKESGMALYRAIKDKVWELNEPSEAKKDAMRSARGEAKAADEGKKAEGEAGKGAEDTEAKTTEAKDSTSQAETGAASADKPMPALPQDKSPGEKRRWSVLATDVVKNLFVVQLPRAPKEANATAAGSTPSAEEAEKKPSPEKKDDPTPRKEKSEAELSPAKKKSSKPLKERTWAKRATQLFVVQVPGNDKDDALMPDENKADAVKTEKASTKTKDPPKPVEKDAEQEASEAKDKGKEEAKDEVKKEEDAKVDAPEEAKNDAKEEAKT